MGEDDDLGARGAGPAPRGPSISELAARVAANTPAAPPGGEQTARAGRSHADPRGWGGGTDYVTLHTPR